MAAAFFRVKKYAAKLAGCRGDELAEVGQKL
jgi:hypothetical protein